MRLLVVEDEKRIADFLCRGLEGAGYAVDAALTGGAALENVHSTDYDLVILDKNLGGESGLDLLKDLRQRNTSLRAIILTEYADVRSAVDSMQVRDELGGRLETSAAGDDEVELFAHAFLCFRAGFV